MSEKRTYEDGYMRGHREGAADKKDKLLGLLKRWDPGVEPQRHAVKNEIMRLLDSER